MNITKLRHPNIKIFKNLLLSVVALFFALFSGIFVNADQSQNAYASDSNYLLEQEHASREDFLSGVLSVHPQTIDDIYQINNDGNLAWLVNSVNGTNGEEKTNFYGKSIQLNYSPDLMDYYWTPIGTNSESSFCGNFNGMGNKISNMTIMASDSDEKYFGFFGFASNVVIKNLNFENAQIGATSNSEFAYAGVVVAYCNGEVLNCRTAGDVVLIGKTVNAGGIAGLLNGKLLNCNNDGNVLITITNAANVGGLIGLSDEKLMFRKNYNVGDVKVVTPSDNNSYLANRYSAGLVGSANIITIEDCFNLGEVYSPSFASGIISNALTSAVVNRVYNSAIISSPIYMDAISTDLDIVVVDSYVNTDFASYSHYATARTTKELKDQANYSTFDFDNVWAFPDSQSEEYLHGYPIIKKYNTASVTAQYSLEATGDLSLDETGIFEPLYSNQYSTPISFSELETDEVGFEGEGTGTQENPYLIQTALQFAKLMHDAQTSGLTRGVYYELIADIDLSDYWKNSDVNDNFEGVLDGNNHFVNNLVVQNCKSGLFDTLTNATIKNINFMSVNASYEANALDDNLGFFSEVYNSVLSGITIEGRAIAQVSGVRGNAFGVLAGKVDGGRYAVDSPLNEVWVGQINDIRIYCDTEVDNACNYVGGVVGQLANCWISNCITDTYHNPADSQGVVANELSVSNTQSFGTLKVGGICGQGDAGTVLYMCENNVQMNVDGNAIVGGILGEYGRVENCWLSKPITSTNNYSIVGGIAGIAYTVLNCNVYIKDAQGQYDGEAVAINHSKNNVDVLFSGTTLNGNAGISFDGGANWVALDENASAVNPDDGMIYSVEYSFDNWCISSESSNYVLSNSETVSISETLYTFSNDEIIIGENNYPLESGMATIDVDSFVWYREDIDNDLTNGIVGGLSLDNTTWHSFIYEAVVCNPIVSGIVSRIVENDAYALCYDYEIKDCVLANDVTTDYNVLIDQPNGQRYAICPTNSTNDANLTFLNNALEADYAIDNYSDPNNSEIFSMDNTLIETIYDESFSSSQIWVFLYCDENDGDIYVGGSQFLSHTVTINAEGDVSLVAVPIIGKEFVCWTYNGTFYSSSTLESFNATAFNKGKFYAIFKDVNDLVPVNSWLDFCADNYESGLGSQESPFEIATPAQLARLLNDCQLDNTAGIYYRLVADIDLSEYFWVINETVTTTFRGNLDGNNKTILNLKTINNSAGFIKSLIGATITNLDFFNVFFKNTTVTSANSGIFGTANDCTIKNISVHGVLHSTAETNNFGGIIGSIVSSEPENSEITNLMISGYINVLNAKNIGGICGFLSNTTLYRSSAAQQTLMILSFTVPEGNNEISDSKNVGTIIGKGDFNSIGILLSSSGAIFLTLSNEEIFANVGALCGQIGAADMCDADGSLIITYTDDYADQTKNNIIAGLVANAGCVVNSYSKIRVNITNRDSIRFYALNTLKNDYLEGQAVTYSSLGHYISDVERSVYYDIALQTNGVNSSLRQEYSPAYASLNNHIWTLNELGEYVHTQHDDALYCATIISDEGNVYGSEIRSVGNLDNVYVIATANYKNKFEAWYLNGRFYSANYVLSVSLSEFVRGTFYAKMQVSTENWWDQYDFNVDTDSPVKSQQITCAEDLAYLAYLVEHNLQDEDNNYYSCLSYTQTADIDLYGYNWIPIGTRYNFCGKYDGNGYKISNMSVSLSEYMLESIISRRDTEILKYSYSIGQDNSLIVETDDSKPTKGINLGLFGTVISGPNSIDTGVRVENITIENGVIDAGTEGLESIYSYLSSTDPDPEDSEDYAKKEFYIGLVAGTCYYLINCQVLGQNNSITNASEHGVIGGLVGNAISVNDIYIEKVSISDCTSTNIGGVVGHLFRAPGGPYNITANISIASTVIATNLGGCIGYYSWDYESVADCAYLNNIIINGGMEFNDSCINVAGIVGNVYIDEENCLRLRDVYIKDCINNLTSISGSDYVSGIANVFLQIPNITDVVIDGCINNAYIISSDLHASGLVYADVDKIKLLNSINYGDVESRGEYGFATGFGKLSNTIEIRNCYNYGNITSDYAACGFIYEENDAGNQYIICVYSINYGNITAAQAYGLFGNCDVAEIYNCGNTGSVLGEYASLFEVANDLILSDSCSTGEIYGTNQFDMVSLSQSERFIIDNSFVLFRNEQASVYEDEIVCVYYSKDRLISDLINAGITIENYFTNMESDKGLPCVNLRVKQERLSEAYVYIDSEEKGSASCMQYIGTSGDTFITEAKANEGYYFVRWLLNGEVFSQFERIAYTFKENEFCLFEAVFRSRTQSDFGMSDSLVVSNGYRLISSFEDLNYLRYLVNECGESFEGSKFLLTKDIVIPKEVRWDGIGKENSVFLGDFYGNNYSITLKIESLARGENYSNGLFAYAGSSSDYINIYDLIMLNATIRINCENLDELVFGLVVANGYANLHNVSSRGSSTIIINGAVAGLVSGLSTANCQIAEKCNNYTNINADNLTIVGITLGSLTANIKDANNYGVFVGSNVYGICLLAKSIKNCSNNGPLTGDNVAGIVCEIGDASIISNTTNNATILSSLTSAGIVSNVGDESTIIYVENNGLIVSSLLSAGLVLEAGKQLIFENCFNKGHINSTNGSSSGLIYTVESITIMNKCGNDGVVTGVNASGLIFHLDALSNDFKRINILTNIYNNASINATNAAAFIFEVTNVEIQNAYNNASIGQNNSYLINRNNFGSLSTPSIITLENTYNLSLLMQINIENYSSINAYHYLSDHTKWIGKSEFVNESTFKGFDFDSIWVIDQSKMCPCFKTESSNQTSQMSASVEFNDEIYTPSYAEALSSENCYQPSYSVALSSGDQEMFDYGQKDTEFVGAGTIGNPFRISSADELRGLAYLVNTGAFYTSGGGQLRYSNAYYKLTADINIGDYNWIPIGLDLVTLNTPEGAYSENAKHYTIGRESDFDFAKFTGQFDGDGHNIYELTMDYSENLLQTDSYGVYGETGEYVVYNNNIINRSYGLFGQGGVISNVVMKNVSINIDDGLFKQLNQERVFVGIDGDYESIGSYNSYSIRRETPEMYYLVEEVGGLCVGSVSGSGAIIERCAALSGAINVANSGFCSNLFGDSTVKTIGEAYIGGLVGLSKNREDIEEMINMLSISVDTCLSPSVGGIVGRIGGSYNRVNNSVNYGEITITNCSLNSFDEFSLENFISSNYVGYSGYSILVPRQSLGNNIGGIVGEGSAAYCINFGLVNCENAHAVDVNDNSNDNYWLLSSVDSNIGRPRASSFFKTGDQLFTTSPMCWDFCENVYPDLKFCRLYTKAFTYEVFGNYYIEVSCALGDVIRVAPISTGISNICWQIADCVVFYGSSVLYNGIYQHDGSVSSGLSFHSGSVIIDGITYSVESNNVLTFRASKSSLSSFNLHFENERGSIQLDLSDLEFAGGQGTSSDPYLISTYKDWALLTALLNGDNYDLINQNLVQNLYPYDWSEIGAPGDIVIDGITYSYSNTAAFGQPGVSNNGTFVALNSDNEITFGGVLINCVVDDEGYITAVSVDGGATWTNTTTRIAKHERLNLLCDVERGFSMDNGATWIPIENNKAQLDIGIQRDGVIVKNDQDNNTALNYTYSIDFDEDLSNGSQYAYRLNSDPWQNMRFSYYDSDNGQIYTYDTLLGLSLNNGDTWSALSRAVVIDNDVISHNGTDALSLDNGQNWIVSDVISSVDGTIYEYYATGANGRPGIKIQGTDIYYPLYDYETFASVNSTDYYLRKDRNFILANNTPAIKIDGVWHNMSVCATMLGAQIAFNYDYDENFSNGSQYAYRTGNNTWTSAKYSYTNINSPSNSDDDVTYLYDTVQGISTDNGETWFPLARAVVINSEEITHNGTDSMSINKGVDWSVGDVFTSAGGTIYEYNVTGANGRPGIKIQGTETYYPLYDYETYVTIGDESYRFRKYSHRSQQNNVPAIYINGEWNDFVEITELEMEVEYATDVDENEANGLSPAVRLDGGAWQSSDVLATRANIYNMYILCDATRGISLDNGISFENLLQSRAVRNFTIEYSADYDLIESGNQPGIKQLGRDNWIDLTHNSTPFGCYNLTYGNTSDTHLPAFSIGGAYLVVDENSEDIAESLSGTQGISRFGETVILIKTDDGQVNISNGGSEHFKQAYYKLTNSIDFEMMTATPILIGEGCTIDGNGFAIDNIYILSSEQNVGIFSENYGVIKNIGVNNAYICTTYEGPSSAYGRLGFVGKNCGVVSYISMNNTKLIADTSSNIETGIIFGIIDGSVDYSDLRCLVKNTLVINCSRINNYFNGSNSFITGTYPIDFERDSRSLQSDAWGVLYDGEVVLINVLGDYALATVVDENSEGISYLLPIGDEVTISTVNCGSSLFIGWRLPNGSVINSSNETFTLNADNSLTFTTDKTNEMTGGGIYTALYSDIIHYEDGSIPLGTWQDDQDYYTTEFEGGEGTESSPYLIRTAEQLAGIGHVSNSYYKHYYKLIADIDISAHKWVPIDCDVTFNGNGHTISGLTIDETVTTYGDFYFGLFGYNLSIIVKSLNLTDVYISIIDGYNTVYGGSSNIFIGAIGARVDSVSGCQASGTIRLENLEDNRGRRIIIGGVAGACNTSYNLVNKINIILTNVNEPTTLNEAWISVANVIGISYDTFEEVLNLGYISLIDCHQSVVSIIKLCGGGAINKPSVYTIARSVSNDGAPINVANSSGINITGNNELKLRSTFSNWHDKNWFFENNEFPIPRAFSNTIYVSVFERDNRATVTGEGVYEIGDRVELTFTINDPSTHVFHRWEINSNDSDYLDNYDLGETFNLVFIASESVDAELVLNNTYESWLSNPLYYDTEFDGEGTAMNPYQISSAAELAGMAYAVGVMPGYNNYDSYYILTNDIDISAHNWFPIGATGYRINGEFGHAFSGSFNGNGKHITGLTINRTPGVSDDRSYGLFGEGFSTSISNLLLKDIDIRLYGEHCEVGALVGRLDGDSIIDSIAVDSGTIYTDSATIVGGIVGTLNSTITNCFSKITKLGNVSGSGLIGEARFSHYYSNFPEEVINCYSISTGFSYSLAMGRYELESSYGLMGTGTGANKTELEMKTASTYGSWSRDIWVIIDNEYPVLKSLYRDTWVSVDSNNKKTIVAGTKYYENGSSILLTQSIVEDSIMFVGWRLPNGEIIKNSVGDYTIDIVTKTLSFIAAPMLSGDYTVIYQYTNFWTKDGKYAAAFAGGNGTQGDPYKIATAAQLARVAVIENNNPGVSGHYVLINNIDLSENYWTEIGIESSKFSGTFDGQGYYIYNLLSSASYDKGYSTFAGLFGFTQQATICNINLVANIASVDVEFIDSDIGVLVINATDTTISNCYCDYEIICDQVEKPNIAIGVIARITGGSVSDIATVGNITIKSISTADSALMAQALADETGVSDDVNNAYVSGAIAYANDVNVLNISSNVDINIETAVACYELMVATVCAYAQASAFELCDAYSELTVSTEFCAYLYVAGIIAKSSGTSVTKSNTNIVISTEIKKYGPITHISGIGSAGEISNSYAQGEIYFKLGSDTETINNVYLSGLGEGIIVNSYADVVIHSECFKMISLLDVLIANPFSVSNWNTCNNSYYAKGDFGFIPRSVEWDQVSFATDMVGRVSALSRNDMTLKEKFANFDFANTWMIAPNINNGRPIIRIATTPSSVVLVTNNDAYGVVEHNGLIINEKSVVIRAIANKGYTFKYWIHHNYIVSTNQIYSIERLRLDSDNKLMAVFDFENTYENTYQIHIDAENGEVGSFANEGPFAKGAIVTVIAHEPNPGFVFDGWYKNEIKQSNLQNYSFIASENISLSAKYTRAEQKWEDNPSFEKRVLAITTISTLGEFVWFMQAVNAGESFANRRVVLSCNIDLSGKLWTPIGTREHPFSGVFDGGYFNISNVTIKGDYEHSGLFGVVQGGEIKNIGINNVRITANSSNALIIGALAGVVNGDINNTEINNCHINAMSDSQLYIGGMVGWAYGTINKSYAKTNITASIFGSSLSKKVVVGGVVGIIKENSYISDIIADSSIVLDAANAQVSIDGIIGNQLEDINANALICHSSTSGTYAYARYLSKEVMCQTGTYSSFESFDRIWTFSSLHDGLPIIKQFNNVDVTFDVTYNLQEAGEVVFSSESYKEGDVAFVNAIVNTGFSFVKWQLDGEDYSTSESIRIESVKQYQSLKVYFKSDITHNFRLITNGGMLDNYYLSVMLGDTIQDKLQLPDLPGKAFVGYRLFVPNGTLVDENTYVSASFSEHIVDGYINIYASYVNQNVVLELHPNGGFLNSTKHSAAYGSVISHLPNPEKNGYVFDGWWTKPGEGGDWGNRIENGNYIYSPLTDLYARYSQFLYVVTATTNDDSAGYVEGVGEYSYGSIVTITVRAFVGYGVSNITVRKGNDVFETAQSIIVLRIESDIAVSVFFTAQNTIVSVFAGDGGTIASDQIVVNSRQIVNATSEITLTASANEGYTFVGWYSDNAFISVENPYTFTASSNTLLTAIFALQTQSLFSVELISSNNELGKVLINGLITRGKYKGGTQVTLSAHPEFGIRFVGWYNGETLISDEITYLYTVTSNLTITGLFETYVYSVLDAIPPQNVGDVYTIASAENLIWLATQVNGGIDFTGKRFVQTRNIDLSNAYWMPIGSPAHPFKGAYDGKGYHIGGMRVYASQAGNYGLFGVVEGASLTAINIRNATIIAGGTQNGINNAGLLCGYATKQTQINECSINGDITGTFGSQDKIGGAIGVSFGSITNCDVNANIIVSGSTALTVGGVVGMNIGEIGFVKSTSSINIACVVDESTSFIAGGIVGINSGINSKVYSSVMMNSNVKIAYSNQSLNENYVGAIIGFVDGSTLLVKGNQYLAQDLINGTGNRLKKAQVEDPVGRTSAWLTTDQSYLTLEWYNVLTDSFTTAWNENIWSITNGMTPILLKAKSTVSGVINLTCTGTLPIGFAERINIKIIGVGVAYSYFISSGETVSLVNLNTGRYRIVCTLADQGYVNLSTEMVVITSDNPEGNVYVTLSTTPSNAYQLFA